MEAETKRRAAIVKQNYVGPTVKFHSVKGANNEEKVRVGKEISLITILCELS